jgi:hypothetical protein
MKNSPGFCACDHSRADHSSDDYDLTEELGKCLIDNCGCEIFSTSIVNSHHHLNMAAPELLEACKYILYYTESVEEALRKISAAVAKAEGK